MDTLAAVISICQTLVWRTNMHRSRGIFRALSAVLTTCIMGVQLARAATQPASLRTTRDVTFLGTRANHKLLERTALRVQKVG